MVSPLLLESTRPAHAGVGRYDPKAITTKNGALEITISKHAEHGLLYTGAHCPSSCP